MNRKLYQSVFFLLVGTLLSHAGRAQTSAANVRLRTDPTVKKVIVEYELPQMLPGDSIYIELETASGRIIRPLSVNGDVGKALKPGKNKLIAWDVVRDNVRLNEDVKVLLRVARMVTVTDPAAVRPKTTAELSKVTTTTATAARTTTDRVAEAGTVVRKKSPLPIIGWVATAGLAGYATVLALGLNKDADAYNAEEFAKDETDLQRYRDLKAKIDKNKGTFTIVAGAAAAVAVANVIMTVVRKPKPSRTTLLIQSGNHVTSLGLSRRF